MTRATVCRLDRVAGPLDHDWQARRITTGDGAVEEMQHCPTCGLWRTVRRPDAELAAFTLTTGEAA